MPEEITEKKIRARLAGGQNRFGDNSIRHLLSIIDEQRGAIAMHEANADEAALKAARRDAAFNSLVARQSNMLVLAEKHGREIVCRLLLDDIDVDGDFPVRLQIELRNLRAQVAEARAAGHPVNLFEELAWQLTTAHKANVVANVEWTETE